MTYDNAPWFSSTSALYKLLTYLLTILVFGQPRWTQSWKMPISESPIVVDF